jgi:hypothetical protein
VEGALLVFLVVLLAWAGITFYLGYWTNGRRWSSGRMSAGFTVIMTLLVPLIGYTLYQQARAPHDLAQLGVAHYPGIKEAMGLPANAKTIAEVGRIIGKPLDEETPFDALLWTFKLKTPAAEALDFYRHTAPPEGWTLVEDTPQALVLIYRREGWRLMIAGDDWMGSTLLIKVTPP